MQHLVVLVLSLVALSQRAQSQLCADFAPSCSVNSDCRNDTFCDATCSGSFVCVAGTSNCSATGRYCRIVVGGASSCVECLTDAHCTAKNVSTKQFCQGNTCIQCTQNSQCTTKADCSATCNGANLCIAGTRQNSNCSAYPYGQCFGGGNLQCSGECFPGGGGGGGSGVGVINFGCQALYPNGSKNYCINTGATYPYGCVNCSQGEDCRSDQNCNANCNGNVCVNANQPANCTALNTTKYCLLNAGACSTCRTDPECITRLSNSLATCDVVAPSTTGDCVVTCTVNSVARQCRSDAFCNATCTSNTATTGVCNFTGPALDCTKTGQICDTAAGVCVECTNNNLQACVKKGEAFCLNGNCSQCDPNPINIIQTTQVCTAIRCGSQCNASSLKCEGGAVCNQLNETCSLGGLGFSCTPVATGCTSDASCTNQSLAYCDFNTGMCVQCTQQSNNCQYELGICNASCVAGVCVAGSPAQNCSASNTTKLCDLPNRICRACLNNADCTNSSKPFCDRGNTYTCLECTGDTDCFKDTDCNAVCNGTGQCTHPAPCNCTNNTLNKICTASGGNGFCSQCKANGDCPANTPYCATSASNVRLCYQCLSATDCRSAQTCDSICSNNVFGGGNNAGGTCTSGNLNCTALYGASATCNNGACRECSLDGDCVGKGARVFCTQNNFFPNYRCVECTTNSNCRNDTNCNGVCTNLACVNSPTPVNCATSGKHCNTGTGQCAACAISADCNNPSLPSCVGGVCVECNSDNQCRSNSNCNAVCSSGVCANRNNYTLNCGTQVCNPANGVCSECTADIDCSNKNASRPYCIVSTAGGSNGVGICMECHPPAVTTGGVAANDIECRKTTDCNATCVVDSVLGVAVCKAGGLSCSGSTPKCLANGTRCAQCLTNSDCSNGKGCNPRDFTCTLDCTMNADCNKPSTCGALCVAGVCETALSVACAAPSLVCTTGGKCVECNTRADCTGGQSCGSNICGFCNSVTDCYTNTSCAGAKCTNNKCDTTAATACTGSSYCDPTKGKCVECKSNNDCASQATNKFCDVPNNKCVPCLTGNNAPCRSDANCNAVCTGNACTNPIAALSCSAQSKVCVVAKAICGDCAVSADCDNDAACGATCTANQCGGATNNCPVDFPTTPHCNAGTCAKCKTDAHCPANQVCTNKVCVAGTKTSGANVLSMSFATVVVLLLARFFW